MIKAKIIFFLLLHLAVRASVDTFFDDDESALVHHVNVITGHLNLYFEDAHLKGAVPYTVNRTFTSAGALDPANHRSFGSDSHKRKWDFKGGWSFLPHDEIETDLWKEELPQRTTIRPCGEKLPTSYRYHKTVYLRQKSGRCLVYTGSSEDSNNCRLNLDMEKSHLPTSIDLKKNLQNSFIQETNERISIYLPDEGETHYKLANDGHGDWIIEKEVLPNRHQVIYFYTSRRKTGERKNTLPRDIKRIEIRNPKGSKILSWIDFDNTRFKEEKKLYATTSDGAELIYSMEKGEQDVKYLKDVETGIRAKESISYSEGRLGIGNRFRMMAWAEYCVSRVLINRSTMSTNMKMGLSLLEQKTRFITLLGKENTTCLGSSLKRPPPMGAF